MSGSLPSLPPTVRDSSFFLSLVDFLKTKRSDPLTYFHTYFSIHNQSSRKWQPFCGMGNRWRRDRGSSRNYKVMFPENHLTPSWLWWIPSCLSCCKLFKETCWQFCSKVSTGLLLHLLLPGLPGQDWTWQQGVEAGEGDAGEGVCLPGLLPLLQQHPAPAAQSLQGKQGEGATADTLGPRALCP